jgi:hypothetical protein
VSELKQLLRSQAKVMKAKQKESDEESNDIKEEKKKMEYTLYELIQAGEVNKDNV